MRSFPQDTTREVSFRQACSCSAFLVFIYYASGQIVYILNYVFVIGLQSFVANINYSYGIALLGLALTTIDFAAAVLVFIQSDKGFAFGLLAGLSSTALFSYQFLNSSTLYMAFISMITFVALILLAYSKISYEVPEKSPYYDVGHQMNWSPQTGF